MARCVREAILPRVYPQAWVLIRRLRAEGEQMLIISVRLACWCRRWPPRWRSIRRWVLTWRWSTAATAVKSPIPSYQQGKVARLAQWREAHPQYDGEVTFYTDSINDLPLCLHADRVRLVNPCPQLQAVGAGYGWPVLSWRLE